MYRAGEHVSNLLVVLSGSVGIVESDPDGDRVVEVHEQGGLLGELGMLEGTAGPVQRPGSAKRGNLAVPTAHPSEVALQDSVLGENDPAGLSLIRRSRLIERGAGMRIIGSCYDADTRRLLEFATRNRLPHRWIDLRKIQTPTRFLRRMKVDRTDTPVVILRTGKLMRNPSNSEVAAELGILVSPNQVGVCDLLVVGAGPAGLAASVRRLRRPHRHHCRCRGGRRPGQYHCLASRTTSAFPPASPAPS